MSTGNTNFTNYSLTGISHADLDDRNSVGQHSMAAIEGLEEELESLGTAQELLSSLNDLLSNVTDALDGKYLAATDASLQYASQTELENLRKELTEITEEFKVLVEDLDIEYPDRLTRLQAVESKIATLSNWYTSSTANFGDLQNKLGLLEMKFADLAKQIDETIKAPEAIRKEVDKTLSETIAEWNATYLELDARIKGHFDHHVAVDGYNAQLEAAQDGVSTLMEELEALRNSVPTAITAAEAADEQTIKYTLSLTNAAGQSLCSVEVDLTDKVSAYLNANDPAKDSRYEQILTTVTSLSNIIAGLQGLHPFEIKDFYIYRHTGVNLTSKSELDDANKLKVGLKNTITAEEAANFAFYMVMSTSKPVKLDTVTIQIGDNNKLSTTGECLARLTCTLLGSPKVQDASQIYEYILSAAPSTSLNPGSEPEVSETTEQELLPLCTSGNSLNGLFEHIGEYNIHCQATEQRYYATGQASEAGDTDDYDSSFSVGYACYYGYSESSDVPTNLSNFYLHASPTAATELTWPNAPIGTPSYYYYLVPAAALPENSSIVFSSNIGEGGFEQVVGHSIDGYSVFRTRYRLNTCPTITVQVHIREEIT